MLLKTPHVLHSFTGAANFDGILGFIPGPFGPAEVQIESLGTCIWI